MSDVNHYSLSDFNDCVASNKNGFIYSSLGIMSFEIQVVKNYPVCLTDASHCVVADEGVKLSTINGRRYVVPADNVNDATHMVVSPL